METHANALTAKEVPHAAELLLSESQHHNSKPWHGTTDSRKLSFQITKVFARYFLTIVLGKYVVLFFYPLDFTFVCPTEIVQFSDKAAEFRAAGCEVIGVSIDSQFSHMEYTKKDRKKGGLGKMDIPLVADVTKSIAKAYGCLIDHGDDNGVAFRATYIIDKNGVVRHISINDLPVGRNIDEVLRLV